MHAASADPGHAPEAPRPTGALFEPGPQDRLVLAAATETWAAVAADTTPADRAAAEEAFRRAYRALGLPEPERIVWYDSPLAAAVAALLVGGNARPGDLARSGLPVRAPAGLRAGASLRERLRTATWQQARDDAVRAIGHRTWAQIWQLTADRLWSPTSNLTARVREAVEQAVLAATGNQQLAAAVRAATLDTMGGQHDAAWLAAFDGLRHTARPDSPDLPDNPALTAVTDAARCCGWWWPYERVVLAVERPRVLHRDDHARLHSGAGPALGYRDGFALHAWRGMPIPADFVSALGPDGSALDVTRIRKERNAELRRVMLEIYGYDRYLAEVGARPLHTDTTGTLWRIELPDDEPVVMVEVVNSTPEPDGTSRTYWLRVPPRTTTARQGVAWTFGLTEHEYHPSRET